MIMYWSRVVAVWLIVMGVETIREVLPEVFLAPTSETFVHGK
jgi:hypothetical protein